LKRSCGWIRIARHSFKNVLQQPVRQLRNAEKGETVARKGKRKGQEKGNSTSQKTFGSLTRVLHTRQKKKKCGSGTRHRSTRKVDARQIS